MCLGDAVLAIDRVASRFSQDVQHMAFQEFRIVGRRRAEDTVVGAVYPSSVRLSARWCTLLIGLECRQD